MFALRKHLNLGQPINRSNPLMRGIVSRWKVLNCRNTGSRLLDLASQNHGTLTNGAAFASAMGRPGGYGSIFFDGTNDWVNIPAGGSWDLPNTTPRTLSCYLINKSGAADINIISNQQNAGSFIGWGLNIKNTTGRLQYFMYNGTSLDAQFPSGYNDGAWHHITITYDGSQLVSGVAFYHNGESVTATAGSDTLSGTVQNSEPFQFSGRGQGAANLWNGYLDNVTLRNRVLSASEVRADFQATRQQYDPTLNWIEARAMAPAVAAPSGNRRRRVILGANR